MKKLNLIIADYDEEYLNSLYLYISSEYKAAFEINCFSNEELLLDGLKEIRNKDNLVLVIDERMYDKSIENMGISTIILLVDYDIDENDIKFIHKYKDIEFFKDKVIRAYSENNPENTTKLQSNNAETTIIPIYSPVGGSGKSTIAAAISVALSQQGKEVFYLNLEDIQSTDLYFNGENNKNLSDVIFEVKDRAENFASKLVSSINVDKNTNVSYLNPTESIFDIEDMTEEDAKWLVEGICSVKKYNYIVIDMSSKYNSLYNMILKSDLTRNIICPIINDNTSLIKLEKYVSNISYRDQRTIEKYYFLYNINNEKYQLEGLNSEYNVNFNTIIPENDQLRKLSGQDVINSDFIRYYMNKIIQELEL